MIDVNTKVVEEDGNPARTTSTSASDSNAKYDIRLTALWMPKQTLLGGKFISSESDGAENSNGGAVLIPASVATIAASSNKPMSISSVLNDLKTKFFGLFISSNAHCTRITEDGLYSSYLPHPLETNEQENECVGRRQQRDALTRLASRLEREGYDATHDYGATVPLNDNYSLVNEALEQEGRVRTVNRSGRNHNHAHAHETFPMTLVVGIRQVTISNHPHFLAEERQAVELERMHHKLTALSEKRDVEYFCSRLSAIIYKLLAMRENSKASKSKGEEKADDLVASGVEHEIHVLYNDMIGCVSKMVSSEHEIYSTYLSILKKWQELCKSRKQQGFQCTTISLSKKRDGPSMMNHDDGDNINALIVSMESMLPWIRDILPTAALDHQEEIKTVMWMIRVVDSTRSSRRDLILASGDESDISNIANFTVEQKRRDLLRSERYVAKLIVNEELVDSTDVKIIDWPAWKIDFSQEFHCSLSSVPSLACVQIYRRRLMGVVPDEFVCSTFVAVPGAGSTIDFSSLCLVAPFEDSYHFDGRGQSGRLSGSLDISVSWDKGLKSTKGWTGDETAPRVDSTSQKRHLQGTRSALTDSGSNIVRQFSSLTQMSLNDYSMCFTMPGTRYSFLNPLRFQEPVRHYLIKQRGANRSDVSSIPLDESNISTDTIKSLIADRKSRYRSDDVSAPVKLKGIHGCSYSYSYSYTCIVSHSNFVHSS